MKLAVLVYNANTVITLVEKTQILVFNGERRGLILLECFKNPMEHDPGTRRRVGNH